MEPQTPSKSKLSIMGFLQSHRIVKFCLIFLVIAVVSAGSYYGYSKMREGKPYFTVVVDCGSTGTRVNVYEWRIGKGSVDLPNLLHSYPDDSTKTHMRDNGCRYHCMQTEPGLDKFVGNSSGVRASLEPLIHWAEGLVPRDRHRDTPVFVLATAGLRRLPEEDAKRVLEDVEIVIKEHSFMWRRGWIRVLSGREEAHYGWIALNYKMGRLDSSSRLPSLGLLDLGGSSLQVVMEAGDNRRKDNHLLLSKIGPIEHQLMAYSLASFGLNKAFDRTVSLLTRLSLIGSDGVSEVRHPCLSQGYISNFTCSSCSRRHSLLHLVGDPNWEKCKILTKAVAVNTTFGDWSEPRIDSSCRRDSPDDGMNVLNVHINANPGVQYHALSGFFAVYNMLNLTEKANLTKIREKAQDLCLTTWGDMENVSSSQYCFKVLYLTSLLEDSLCLGGADIIFGPGDISWTLGASLVEGEHAWHRNNGGRTVITMPQYMEIISSPILLFIVLAVLLFVVYHSQLKLPKTRKRSVVGEPLPSFNYSKHRPH